MVFINDFLKCSAYT